MTRTCCTPLTTWGASSRPSMAFPQTKPSHRWSPRRWRAPEVRGLPVTEKLKERFNSTPIKEIEQAYVQMNTVNWLLAQKMGKPVMPVSMGSPFQQSSEQALHGQAVQYEAHTALSRSEQDQDNASMTKTVKITESVPSWQAKERWIICK